MAKIVTKYIPPTDYKGSKVLAKFQDGKKLHQLTVGFHCGLCPHITAASRLVEKIGGTWADWSTCYRIVRVFEDGHDRQVLRTGLTLEAAQEWCQDPETSSSTCTSQEGLKRLRDWGRWFDCHEEDGWTNNQQPTTSKGA